MDDIQLFNGDCLDVMPTLPAASVDLTVTSPPYDNLRTYNDSLNDWSPAKWQAVLRDLYRITKPGGVVVWVVGDATVNGSETGTSFRQALHAMECGFRLHDTMIYRKKGGGATGSNKAYIQNFEYMFVFAKGDPNAINLLYDRKNNEAEKTGRYRTRTTRLRPDGSIKDERRQPAKEYGRRFNVWEYSPAEIRWTAVRDGFRHPAMFPESLAQDHILSWSNPGDVVFDPFSGSGTTGKMAIKSGRRFIGIERDPKYFAICQERIGVKRRIGETLTVNEPAKESFPWE